MATKYSVTSAIRLTHYAFVVIAIKYELSLLYPNVFWPIYRNEIWRVATLNADRYEPKYSLKASLYEL